MPPRVSVILNFLNGERFIAEAIDSVLNQTFTSWELLLVDDGSIDGSSDSATRFAAAQPDRVRYLEHPGHANRGASASRNLGIRQARGAYIAFLDCDDVWFPQKLSEQVAILDSELEAAMVYGLSEFWYSWTGRASDRNRDFVHHLGLAPDSLVRPPALLIPHFLHQTAAIPSPSNILVRREALERVGAFEEQFQLYTDQSLYAKIWLEQAVFVSGACWDRYRQHGDSAVAVAQRAGREYAYRLFFLEWLAGYLQQHGPVDAAIWRALRAETARCRHPRVHALLADCQRKGRRLLRLSRALAWRPRTEQPQ